MINSHIISVANDTEIPNWNELKFQITRLHGNDDWHFFNAVDAGGTIVVNFVFWDDDSREISGIITAEFIKTTDSDRPYIPLNWKTLRV